MKTIEQNTDEFIKYVGIVKRWFKDEELEVSDYVIGRMASRIQTLFKDETKALQDKIETLENEIQELGELE